MSKFIEDDFIADHFFEGAAPSSRARHPAVLPRKRVVAVERMRRVMPVPRRKRVFAVPEVAR